MAAERWEPNSQITAQHLNDMIDDTASAMTIASSIAGTANEAKLKAQEANTKADNFSADISRAQNTATYAKEKADSNESKITSLRSDLTSEIQSRQESDSVFNSYASEIRQARDGETTLKDKLTKLISAINNTQTITDDITNVIGSGSSLRTNLNNFIGTTNAVHDAAMNFPSLDSRLDQIDQKIETAESNAKSYANTAIQDKLNTIVTATQFDNLVRRVSGIDGGALDESATKTHAQRLSALENQVINEPLPGETNIKSNVAALINEVSAAHRQDDDTLDARFEGIDYEISHEASQNDATVGIKERLTSAETDIQTIATELGMLDNSIIQDTQTRIDNIEFNINHTKDESDENDLGGLVQQLAEVKATADAAAVETNVTEALNSVRDRLTALDDSTDNESLISRVGTIENTMATDTDLNTLSGQVDTIQSAINNETTGLAATKTIADNAIAAIGNDNSGLTKRIKDLETAPKSATKVIDSVVYNSEGIPINIDNPSIDVDYLLKKDNKYYYWKYIQTSINPPLYSWELISGGGGTSGNNADEYQTYEAFEQATPQLDKDYYVLQNDNVWHHYRYLNINSDPIEIGTSFDVNNVNKYQIVGATEDNKNYLDFYKFNYDADIAELDLGTRIAHIELVGGGSGNYSTKKITPITPRATKEPITKDNKVYLRFFYTSGELNDSDYYTLTWENATTSATVISENGATINSGDPQDASRTWPVNEETQELKDPSQCPVGFYAFDVTEYCKTVGKQTFTLKVTDLDDDTLYTVQKWEIQMIALNLQSNFTENLIVPINQAVTFTYTPEGGNIEKTVEFYLDNTLIGEETLGSRIADEQTYIIPAQSVEKAYKLSARLRASDNGKFMYSDFIYRDIIWKDETSDTIILSSPYRDRIKDIEQYDTIEIPYSVAGPNNQYIVKYYVNDFIEPVDQITLNNTSVGKWIYRPLNKGTQNLRIQVEDVYIDLTLNVTENVVDIAPVTANLVLNFDPTGLNNNSETAKNWTNGNYHLTVSDNFDWFNGGYGSNEEGDYFLIKSGTRAYFDYKMFMQETESIESQGGQTITLPTSKVYKTGQEMKIIFKTSSVRAIDAIWFTNMGKFDSQSDTKVGIQLSVHEGFLKTDTASDEAVGSGDEQVAATNTYLYFPYSEEDKIELDININKENSSNGTFAMSYEDGVPSKAYAYTHNQILYHIPSQESIITIGSDDCDVYLYKLKIYDNELTPAQVLRNFIADGKSVEESITRYNRNCIYYNAEDQAYSPYATNGFILDPEALASKIPNVKVLMLDTPSFTLNKKSFIKDSSLRCIHAPGGTIYKSRGAADNWLFENGYHAGQGTTSDKYGDAGRNVDFLFNCDGIHKPSDKVKPIEGYVSKVTIGYGTANVTTSTVTDWKGTSGKISLTESSIPNNFFNFKVNIASSENVNNALLQKRYNDFLPYVSPASVNQLAKYGAAYQNEYNLDLSKLKVKNDMEFVPAVLFVRERGTGETVHSEFGDNNWHFYALGNLGDSKKTDYTRAYDPDDYNEFTIEISDNNTNNSQFQTGVYMLNGSPTNELFEAVQDIDDEGNLIDDSYTAQGRSGAIATTDYIYPLDTPELKALWNETDSITGELKNKSHWALVNEPYDGDHSFEMRYACCGDYRDGKMVNDTTGNGSAQREINSKVWQAFYSWIVTSSNEEFIRDLDQWCVRSAVEFWYAFTHYYTMMDNRAKNTFWHFAKTGKYRKVTNPVQDMFHVYKVSSDAQLVAGTTNEWIGTFTTPEGSFNDSAIYYTEYAFDLWDYDNDTALGIDNNGELIFPYGKEDKDYRLSNNPASGYVFNGAGSVFWRRLRDLCTSEISSIFNTVAEQFFSAENLIKQFDDFQECYPEALWQVDIQRKYIRPFINDKGKTLPNGSTEFLTRQSKRFLESMMQGRKKYQRRQWIKDQYYYFGSKYRLNNIMEDFFYLDCYTGPDDALIAQLKEQNRYEEADQYVGSNWDLTITPYQDMYISASFGETAKPPVRAYANEPVEMTCPFTSMNNTRIYIYGASRIKALGGKAIRNDTLNPEKITDSEGLASLYIGVNSIEKTDKLQQLYLGTDKTTYNNPNLKKLTLNESSPILETLNIKNCGGLAGELKLGGCNNLRTLIAEGTNIATVELPASSQITTLRLPNSLTSLTLRAARNLSTFIIANRDGESNYDNLNNILIDNSDENEGINWIKFVTPILSKLNYLYLLQLKTSSIDTIEDLRPLLEKKNTSNNPEQFNLTGIIEVNGKWNEPEAKRYAGTINIYQYNITQDKDILDGSITSDEAIWPDLTLNVHREQQEIKFLVQYVNADANNTILYEYYAVANSSFIDPYYDQLIDIPTIPADKQYSYIFGEYYEDNVYKKYSGWMDNSNQSTPNNSTTIGSNKVYKAVYGTKIAQQYTIKWWKDENRNTTPLQVITERYGVDITNIPAPTRRNEGLNVEQLNTVISQIESGDGHAYAFKGWDKNLSILTDNIDVTAQWERSTLNFNNITGIQDFSTLNAADLYGISQILEGQTRKSLLEDYNGSGIINIQMGNDLNYEGITTNILENAGSTPYQVINRNDLISSIITDITPFNNDSDDFTFVIDFKLLNDADNSFATEAIIASCSYINDNTETTHGFRIIHNRVNNNLQVYWGRNQFQNIDIIPSGVGTGIGDGYRNIIVIRHKSESKSLDVYYHQPDSSAGDVMFGNVISQTLTNPNYSKTNLSNIPIIIGGNYNINSSPFVIENNEYRKPAYATIYYCKYYNEAMSDENCKLLCSWTHETIPFALTGYANNISYNNAGTTLTVGDNTTKLNFTALSALSDRGYKPNFTTQDANGNIGWAYSELRTYCNNVLFYAMPITYQSIILNNYVSTNKFTLRDGSYNSYDSERMSIQDYIYLPSLAELQQISQANYGGLESRNIWSNLLKNTTIYSIRDNVIYINDDQNDTTVAMLRERFLRTRAYSSSIVHSGILYVLPDDPATAGYRIGTTPIQPAVGDCWYNTTPGNNTFAIYSGTNWIPTIPWRTRTFAANPNSAGSEQFYRVTAIGSTVSGQSNNSANASNLPCGLNIEFSV